MPKEEKPKMSKMIKAWFMLFLTLILVVLISGGIIYNVNAYTHEEVIEWTPLDLSDNNLIVDTKWFSTVFESHTVTQRLGVVDVITSQGTSSSSDTEVIFDGGSDSNIMLKTYEYVFFALEYSVKDLYDNNIRAVRITTGEDTELYYTWANYDLDTEELGQGSNAISRLQDSSLDSIIYKVTAKKILPLNSTTQNITFQKRVSTPEHILMFLTTSDVPDIKIELGKGVERAGWLTLDEIYLWMGGSFFVFGIILTPLFNPTSDKPLRFALPNHFINRKGGK